jgi:hypothetical protein
MSTTCVSTSNFNPSTGLSEFQRNRSPIFPEQLDKTGNQLRLWETEKGELCATVMAPQGKVTCLAPSRIINPLGNGFTPQAIQYIKTHPSHFDLVYTELQ